MAIKIQTCVYICSFCYIWILFTSSTTTAEECASGKADIVFVVDDSSSVQRTRFNKVLDFVQGIVLTLNVGPATNRISFISFSSTVKSQFYLDDYTTKNAVLKKIDGISFRGGGTNIERALIQARDKNFLPANGARAGVGKVLVLITDGTSTVDEAVPRSIREAGIKIICIGIADADTAQLQAIAGDSGYVQIIQTFDELAVIHTEATSATCAATKQSMCTEAPCLNGGTCTDTTDEAGFTCTCALQFTGNTCDTVIDPCESQPCLNGGACAQDGHSFSCACASGFTGDTCGTFLNPCMPQPCMNGGTCLQDGHTFSCTCTSGFTGVTCDTKVTDPCMPQPCLNGGTCLQDGHTFSCSCASGFTGVTCDTKSDGTCQPETYMALAGCKDFCHCDSGGVWRRKTCLPGTLFDKLVTNCNAEDQVTCDVPDRPFEVDCPLLPVSVPCMLQPCMNGGTCLPDGQTFSCTCTSGFTGVICDTKSVIDVCESQPCLNGATCTSKGSTFSCICLDGFIGDTCQTDIDDCWSSPCLNLGRCQDAINGYLCTCDPGFSGHNCQIADDQTPVTGGCADMPCENLGDCTDLGNDFTCSCRPGYTGKTCHTDINDCWSSPCLNLGRCQDAVNAYRCICDPGFSGHNCQIVSHEDDCVDITCQNGGTCVDLIGQFGCACTYGFSGTLCETATSGGHGGISPLGLGVTITLGVLCLIAAGCLLIFLVRKRLSKDNKEMDLECPGGNKANDDVAGDLDDVAASGIKNMSLKKLQEPLLK